MKKSIFLVLILINSMALCVQASKNNENWIDFRKYEIEHKTSAWTQEISSNSKGDVAVSFEDDFINVYDENGKFKHGFRFEIDGAYYFLFDKDDNINIYTVRGNTRFCFNTKAELVKEETFENGWDISKSYKLRPDKTNLKASDKNYELKNRLGYCTLTKTDSKGNKTIIYETGSYYNYSIIKVMIIFVGIAIVLFVVTKITINSIKKYNTLSK